MKHLTIKSNMIRLTHFTAKAAGKDALKRLLPDVPVHVFEGPHQPTRKAGYVFFLNVYEKDPFNGQLQAFLGQWRVYVPKAMDKPLRVSFCSNDDMGRTWPKTDTPYRPARLSPRLAALCPDVDLDDPFDGAANWNPYQS